MPSFNKKTSRLRDSYQDFIMHRFLKILKDIPLDRYVTDGYSEAMCSLADIIFDSFENHDDVEVELLEKRWPQLWFLISDKHLPSNKNVILIMYGYSYSDDKNIGMLIVEGNDTKAVSGDAEQITKHLKNYISGKPILFSDYYRIKPYTKFLATLESTVGFDIIDRITDWARKNAEERIGNYMTQPLSDEQNKRFFEFTQWLTDRCYYSIMSSIKQTGSKFTFCFKTYTEVKLVFDCDDAGEYSLKSILLLQGHQPARLKTSHFLRLLYYENELRIRTIDDARMLECAINEKTGLTNDKEVFNKLIGE